MSGIIKSVTRANKQRNKSVYQTVGGNIVSTKYYVGSYEKEIMGNNSVKEYDYIYTPEGLGAIVTKTGGSYSISYVHTDHLGSPRVISNGTKAVLARYSYDAWGKRTLVAGANITNRGFTGHEHIDEFGMINMNARLYAPTLGRFISIDPYVQMPDFSQSFNRYSYALNNPLSFTDPTGEFFIGTIITFIGDLLKTAFFDGGLDLTSESARQNAWKNFDPSAKWSATNKAWRIDIGGFKTDPNRTVAGRGLQLLSRWTWELPQTLLGKGYSHLRNMTGNVDRVDYFGGATFVTNENAEKNNGVSLGSYINTNIDHEITGDFENYVFTHSLYMHEYGHTFDSRLFGISYLFVIGIPSIISAAGEGDHNAFWTEIRADSWAANYFKRFGVVWKKQFYRRPDLHRHSRREM